METANLTQTLQNFVILDVLGVYHFPVNMYPAELTTISLDMHNRTTKLFMHSQKPISENKSARRMQFGLTY